MAIVFRHAEITNKSKIIIQMLRLRTSSHNCFQCNVSCRFLSKRNHNKMDTKQKFVRLKKYNEVIIFPCIIEHSDFKNFNPISAGFCYVNSNKNRVDCFGESFSLGLKSDPKEDTLQATKQIFGIDAMLELMSENGS